jgi:Fe-S cluster biogenesis protein NfuA
MLARKTILKRFISVHAEQTPNPEALMFYLDKGKDVLGQNAKSMTFTDKYSCGSSALASSLFRVHGVSSILLGPKHITINKLPQFEWNSLRPNIELVIGQFFDTGMPAVRPEAVEKLVVDKQKEATEVEARILDLLEERVRPFVQQDGGDLEFVSYDLESGLVTVKMQGACSGCPKSAVTLKMGIERMLKHYIPEISGVINLGTPEEAAQ